MVALAKSAGKTRATAKHLATGEVRKTLKGITKNILREAEIEKPASPEGDHMASGRMPWALYKRWKALA